MSNVAGPVAPAPVLSWDGEGRRVPGGPLAPDLTAPPDEELTFSDFLSAINPLQHLPIISSIYRWVTGDTIKPVARVVGGALYGGPIGLASAVFNAIVEQVKGADLGAQALALLAPTKDEPSAPQVAAADRAGAEPAAPDAERAASNLAALQQLAADLRIQTPQPIEAKPAEPPPLPPLQPGQARSLAYYQANAGRRLVAADTSRYTLPQRPASLPLAAPTAIARQPEAPDKAAPPAAANPGEGPPAAWFAAAMMRGLDRYRTTQSLDKAAPQVDLSH